MHLGAARVLIPSDKGAQGGDPCGQGEVVDDGSEQQ